MAKKKAPTLPEQLRKLADDIEEATKPRHLQTPEAMLAEFNQKSFKQRLMERRERLANENDERGEGDGNPATLRPIRRPRAR